MRTKRGIRRRRRLETVTFEIGAFGQWDVILLRFV